MINKYEFYHYEFVENTVKIVDAVFVEMRVVHVFTALSILLR